MPSHRVLLDCHHHHLHPVVWGCHLHPELWVCPERHLRQQQLVSPPHHPAGRRPHCRLLRSVLHLPMVDRTATMETTSHNKTISTINSGHPTTIITAEAEVASSSSIHPQDRASSMVNSHKDSLMVSSNNQENNHHLRINSNNSSRGLAKKRLVGIIVATMDLEAVEVETLGVSTGGASRHDVLCMKL